MIYDFSQWLAATPLSSVIQDVSWVIPAVQTVHIVSIAIVMTSMAMLDLRLLGVAGRRQSLEAMGERFLPWTWSALAVLLLSGSTLIVGEPARELGSSIFWLKMSLLAAALVLTACIQLVLKHGAGFWERHRSVAALTGTVSLGLWLAILAAGRWIAYGAHG